MATQAQQDAQVQKGPWVNESFEMILDDQLLTVLTALRQKPVMVDDHNGRFTERPVEGVALVRNDFLGTFLCPIYRREWTSLNQLYVGLDGRVHLSTRSISGNLSGFPRHSPDFTLDSIESVREVAKIGTDIIHDVEWFNV
jgi:hypothetical protein